jgi:CBS domain-containing protein
MWEFDCGLVLVVGDDGRLIGVVTDRDVCLAAYMHHKPLHLIPVAKAMARAVISVQSDRDVQSVEDLMRLNGIRRIPVTDRDGRPAGVVSLDDLAQAALSTHDEGAGREVVRTLAAVAAPRLRDHTAGPLVR